MEYTAQMARDRSDIKVTASDALEFEPVETTARPRSRRGLKMIFGVAALVGVLAGAWFVYGDTLMAKRAAFTRHHIWATPYRTEERYPAGVYVNQSNGEDGIETWTAADRNIENTDIVVWHTFGIMHLPRLEDFPVQPVVRCGFALVADGFFDENPTLDMPPSTDGGNA